MKPTLVITHLEDRQCGFVGEALTAAGLLVREVNFFAGERLPSVDETAAVISLGGKMSVTELDQSRFLKDELALMRSALVRRVPLLGICLGAQLLSVAGGGKVSRMPQPYIAWPELRLTDAAQLDPLASALRPATRVLKWHQDRIELPADATVLGLTDSPGAALFRIGSSAWGSQMHIEVTLPMLSGWLKDPDEASSIESAGHRPADWGREARHLVRQQSAAVRPVFARFATLIENGSMAAAIPATPSHA